MSIFGLFKRDRLAPIERVIPKIPPPTGNDTARRSWRAGEYNDLTADWMITPQWSYSLTQRYLSTLRARARAEYRTNDYAKRYVGMLKNGIVGPEGFQLQCMFEDPRGVDTVANRAFEKHWRLWSEDPVNCDVRAKSTLLELCNQLVGQLATDGEFFVQWHKRGPMDYQLQIVEPLTIDLTYHDDLKNGRFIRFGLEIDEYGRTVAYYKNVGQNGDYPYPTGSRERIPASNMYHCFISEGVDQLRGFPWLSTPMYRMHMLDGFEESAAVNARAGAAKMGFKQSRDPERYSGEAGGAGAGVEEIHPGVHVDYLAENEEWVTYDPSYPQGEFKDYVQQMLRGIASGLEVSYPTLANDLAGVNYTSLRHDALTERDVYMRLQRWFSSHFLRPMYDDWLVNNLREGIPIPRVGGGTRPAAIGNYEKYRKVKFAGRRWQWVDPMKEIQAAQKAVELGVTTRAQIIRDSGRDPDEVLIEVENERKRFGTPDSTEPGSAEQAIEGDKPDDTEESDDSDGGDN